MILAALLAALQFTVADDFKTINGKEYKNAEVSRVEADGIVLITKSGISKLYFTELPKEVQLRFGYDAAKIEAANAAARAAEEKRIEEEQAAERERVERKKEKEKNADADLKRSLEQFQATEQSAAQSYQSATKGILSGQIFVSTRGGESFKLGAVPVSLFDRKAIDALIPAAKIYADIKIQELSPSVDAAKVTMEQAEAAERAALGSLQSVQAFETERRTRDDYQKILSNRDFYYSGAFYLGLLVSPIQTAETDADGKFTIEVPKTGAFVVAAMAERYVGITEHYYWLQPVSLEGQQKRVQNLSNNNLTSTTGTSALILTQD